MFKFPKLARLVKSQKTFRRVVAKALTPHAPKPTKRPLDRSGSKTTLTEITDFGSNPGRLIMKLFNPKRTSGKPPLVVDLHGWSADRRISRFCQWFSALARERGFILLYPQQPLATILNDASTGFDRARLLATVAI